MKYICVFCSAKELPEKYTSAAVEFCTLLANHGYGLVWGGNNMGLMKVVADTVQNNGGKVVGVSLKILEDFVRPNADEMIMTDDLGERKKIMMEKADAFVMLTGGSGTLDEISEIIELKMLQVIDKPIVILNIDDFYQGLFTQYARMEQEGFLKKPMDAVFKVFTKPSEAIAYIDSALQV